MKNSFYRLLKLIRRKYLSLKYMTNLYNHWTIAEYFRAQGAKIGTNCAIDIRRMTEPYLVNIGNHVFIARDVILHTHEGGVWLLREEFPNIQVFGKIVIEDNCLIGANSHILPNVRIGRNSVVGAGSVVIMDVPPNSIVMGNPARIVGSTLNYREKYLEKWEHQKPPVGHFKNQKQYWLELDRFMRTLVEETEKGDEKKKDIT